MNGTRALIFSRSRHAAGIEGSDFSRSQRQQKIITAMKAKVTQINFISDISTINNLASVVGDHFHTNISPGEIFRLYSLVKDFTSENVISLSLDPATKLICPEILPENGAYVLVPCQGHTTADVQDFFKNSFLASSPPENTVIWLSDSTTGKTHYKGVEKILTDSGYTVYGFDFTGKVLLQTVAYQVNERPQTIDFLKAKLGATEVSLPPPGMRFDKTRVDVIVVLGDDGQTGAATTEQKSTK
jgi:hypothetical protein